MCVCNINNSRKVFVIGVKPDGAAGRDGRIQVGDQLLEINNTTLDGENNHQAARELISQCESTLVLVTNRFVYVLYH